jgi:integrase
MDSISKKEIIDFHLGLKAENLSGATCDHFLKLLKRCYSLATDWEFIAIDKLRGIKCFNEPNQCNDVLTEEEFARLLAVLHSHPNQLLCRIVRYLFATGCRLGEALSAKHEDLQMDKCLWLVPATNSKNKKMLIKPLSSAAMEVISEVSSGREAPTGYLFVNPRTGDRLYSIHKGWHAIRKEAGLPNMKLKSARQHFASTLVNAGRSLLEVSTLLGHSSQAITAERYTRLSSDTLHQAANVASDQLQAASPKPTPPDLKLVHMGP